MPHRRRKPNFVALAQVLSTEGDTRYKVSQKLSACNSNNTYPLSLTTRLFALEYFSRRTVEDYPAQTSIQCKSSWNSFALRPSRFLRNFDVHCRWRFKSMFAFICRIRDTYYGSRAVLMFSTKYFAGKEKMSLLGS